MNFERALLKELDELNTQISVDAKQKKMEAQKFAQQAVLGYKQAELDLHSCQSTTLKMTKEFGEAIQDLKKLMEEAKEEKLTEKSLETFVKQAENILERMTKIFNTLEVNTKRFDKGMKGLKEASVSYKNALSMHHEAFTSIAKAVEGESKRKLMEADKKLNDVHGQLKEAQGEVKGAQQRTEIIQKVVDHQMKKLGEIQSQVDGQFKSQDLLAGIGATTVILLSGTTGAFIPITVGIGATFTTHYTTRIYHYVQNTLGNNTNRIKEIHHSPIDVKDKLNEKATASLQLKEVACTFDSTSSGYYGYGVGKLSEWTKGEKVPSKTVGEASIKLSDGSEIICRFNRKSSSDQGKMDESHMKDLAINLREKVKSEKMSPQACLDLLGSLQSAQLSDYFLELKMTCQEMIEKSKEVIVKKEKMIQKD